MSDQKYVNYYIEHAVGLAHEYLNTILQLKTQLKVLDEVVSEKNDLINSLVSEIETLKTTNIELEKFRSLQTEIDILRSKTSHLDTALSQISQMKKEIVNRDTTISKLNEKINPSKKQRINTKRDVPVEIVKTAPTDDF